MKKIQNYLTAKKIAFDFSTDFFNENVHVFSQDEKKSSCKIKCIICEKNIRCNFDGVWRISNYTQHIIDHKDLPITVENPANHSPAAGSPEQHTESEHKLAVHRPSASVLIDVKNALNSRSSLRLTSSEGV